MKNPIVKLIALFFIIMPLSIMFNGWVYMEAYQHIFCTMIENIWDIEMPNISYGAFISLLFIFMLFSSNKNTVKKYDDLSIEFFTEYIATIVKKLIILALGITITYIIL